MFTPSKRYLVSFVLAAVATPACTKLNSPLPDTPLVEAPSVPESAVERAAQAPEMPWWERFGDDALSALIERGLRDNLSIRQAWIRVESAKAAVERARAARFPTARLSASAGWSRTVGVFGGTSQNLSASIPISYELDVFARAARTHQAAELSAEASLEDLKSMAVSLSAEIAEAWFNIVDARARQALLIEQNERDNTYLELVQLRFQSGLASAVDVSQQRLSESRSRSQIELSQMEVAIAELQLALLLGLTHDELEIPETALLPEPPPVPAAGVTADLIANRPDIRAARHRVESADRSVAAAIAARLPSIGLSVTPGYAWNRNQPRSGSLLGDDARVSHGFTISAGASLNLPLFDGFLGRASVRTSRANLDLSIETLRQRIVQALFEVELAIRQEHHQARNLVLLMEQLSIAQETLVAARDRFSSGLSDYLPVLTALQSVAALELSIQTAKRNVLSAQVQIHRALGGTWPEAIVQAGPPRRLGVISSDEEENAP